MQPPVGEVAAAVIFALEPAPRPLPSCVRRRVDHDWGWSSGRRQRRRAMSRGARLPKVLVVDDSAADRRLVGGLLERSGGLAIETAVDGEEALCRFQSCVPDLVVTDLIMPQKDGMELVSAIKSEFPLVPVVLMTARGNEEIALAALRGGAAGYVPKRILAQDLAATVKRILAASREDRSLARLMHRMCRNESSFVLHNDASLIPLLLGYLQQVVRSVQLEDELDRLRIRLAVEEALLNALYHGNLEVGSQVGSADPNAFEELVRSRCAESPYRDRRIHVSWTMARDGLTVSIRDEGPGFDLPPQDAPVSVDFDTLFGRGLLIMRTFMDEVRTGSSRNEVVLVKRSAAPDDSMEAVD
jgi:CheY-like chemotaxis protein/anti-sigma regulatory factor (Ser/Thr protein kinase)